MSGFAELVDGLAFAPADAARVALLGRYLATTPDPERGWGLAAVSGRLALPRLGPARLRALAAARLDPVLFALSLEFVGDLAETVALMWPGGAGTGAPPPTLAAVVAASGRTAKGDWPGLVAGWLDAAPGPQRPALLALLTGRLRPSVAPALVWQALAGLRPGAGAEEVAGPWQAEAPPWPALFAWLDGRGALPEAPPAPVFSPPMRARVLVEAELERLDPALLAAEWHWDGERVQLVAEGGGRWVYSARGLDVSARYPALTDALVPDGVLDGVLPAAPGDGRLVVFDLLFDGGADLRRRPFAIRRARLEAWFARARSPVMRLSPLLAFTGAAGLRRLRDNARGAGARGVVLKHLGATYRPEGSGWWAWARAPLRREAVLLYVERGTERGRGGDAAGYTVGLWREDGVLVPVGRAVAALQDAARQELDRWIAAHTIARFGPVREVEPALVVELAYDAVLTAPRRKAGLVLRAPRIIGLCPERDPRRCILDGRLAPGGSG